MIINIIIYKLLFILFKNYPDVLSLLKGKFSHLMSAIY